MGSSGWCSPTRPPLLPLLPSISIYVLRRSRQAQQLHAIPRNLLGATVSRLPYGTAQPGTSFLMTWALRGSGPRGQQPGAPLGSVACRRVNGAFNMLAHHRQLFLVALGAATGTAAGPASCTSCTRARAGSCSGGKCWVGSVVYER